MGLGDIQSLIEKAKQVIPEDEAQVLATKVLTGNFDLEDLLKQFEFMEKMGPLDKLLEMIPGLSCPAKKLKNKRKHHKKEKGHNPVYD
jgi:signal recognition particle subunit SRP54